MNWFWQMKRDGSGPHFYLDLQFANADANEFQTVAKSLLMSGFELHANEYYLHRWLNKGFGEWSYVGVDLRAQGLGIELGWGRDDGLETPILKGLLPSHFELTHWSIHAGGDGYAPKFYRSGSHLDHFLAYVRREIQAPDFALVQRRLEQMLAAQELRHQYTRIDWKVVDESATATLIYPTPPTGSVDMTDEIIQLTPIARKLSDACEIAVSFGAACVHAPNNWHQIIGSRFDFGSRPRS